MITYLDKPIKALLFDFDHTLRTTHPRWGEIFAQQAALRGVPINGGSVLHAEREVSVYFASDKARFDFDRFAGDEDSLWRHFRLRYLVALGCPAEKAEEIEPELAEVMKEAYQPQEILLPGVEETLQRLRLHDLMMGVVTNRGHSIDDKMESLNLSPYFDFVLTGGDIDVYKPDVRIFEHALKLAQSIPEETIYVGDNYHADVIGARNAGIHPILVNTYDLFPNADCPIIQEIGDLLILLGLE